MRHKLATANTSAEQLLPPIQPDGSGIGVNYVEEYVTAFNTTLEDGRRVSCTRKGLKITLTVGDQRGHGLMRRLENGPDPKQILRLALDESAGAIGCRIIIDDGVIYLEESP